MKLNRIFAALFLGLCLSFVMSCDSNETPDKEIVVDNVNFSLGVDRATLQTADIRVRHDGDADLKWVYLYTADLESDPDELIDEAIASEVTFTDQILAEVGNNKSVRLTGLLPKTYYRIIVKAIAEDGTPIGKATAFEFRTRRDADVFEVNENWKVERSERSEGFYPGSSEIIEFENFKCISTDEEPYIIALIKASDFSALKKDPDHKLKIRTFFEQYLASSGLEPGSDDWIEIIEKGDCTWQEQRLRHGDWIVFMVGVDEEGELTGLYAQFDVNIPEETPTDDFNKFVGTWEVSAFNDGMPTSFTLTILSSEANMWYTSIGWEPNNLYGYDPVNLPVEIFYDKKTGKAYLVSQHVATAVDDTGLYLHFYFYGSFPYGDGNTYIPVENQRLAELTINEDGTEAKVTGLEFSISQAGTTLSFRFKELIYLLRYEGQDNGSPISLEHPDLPFTMKKIS